jgi:hypothetical protein
MTSHATVKLTAPQRKVLAALAATGRAPFRSGMVLGRLQSMGLIEYQPVEPGWSMCAPHITEAGRAAISNGPKILADMLNCNR